MEHESLSEDIKSLTIEINYLKSILNKKENDLQQLIKKYQDGCQHVWKRDYSIICEHSCYYCSNCGKEN